MTNLTKAAPTADAPTALQLRSEVFERADRGLIHAMGGDRQAWVLALGNVARSRGLVGAQCHIAVIWGLAQAGFGS